MTAIDMFICIAAVITFILAVIAVAVFVCFLEDEKLWKEFREETKKREDEERE